MRTRYVLICTLVSVCFGIVLFVMSHTEETISQPHACTMEARICPDGSAVGRTGPNCEFEPCPTEAVPVADDMIRITTPREGETVTSPVRVAGEARGNWFFEGSFPITIVNWDGLIIGEGFATAQGDWMTTEFVPFTGTLSYTLAPETPYNRGSIIFRKDNPSGLPEYDDAREFQIFFSEITSTGNTD